MTYQICLWGGWATRALGGLREAMYRLMSWQKMSKPCWHSPVTPLISFLVQSEYPLRSKWEWAGQRRWREGEGGEDLEWRREREGDSRGELWPLIGRLNKRLVISPSPSKVHRFIWLPPLYFVLYPSCAYHNVFSVSVFPLNHYTSKIYISSTTSEHAQVILAANFPKRRTLYGLYLIHSML